MSLNVAASGVLSSYSDVDGDTLSAVLVSQPTHGSLTLNGNGSFSYVPAANYNGTDSFTYKANDGQADSGIATVNITVTAVNDPPVGVNDSYTTVEEHHLERGHAWRPEQRQRCGRRQLDRRAGEPAHARQPGVEQQRQ